MQRLAVVFVLLFLVSPALAEGDEGNPRLFKSDRYSIQLTGPDGWKQTLKEPTPAGAWVDLVRYQEEKTGALLQLSVQVTNYRSSEEMIQGLSDQFQKAASLAVLRQEVQAETPNRPRGILFEYSQRDQSGQRHKIAAYWFSGGRRYRMYGSVKEIGWKVAGADMEAAIKSVAFTTREFSRQVQNFTDVEQNYALYYPDGWTVTLPGSGPRVEFESTKLGAVVRLWVTKVSGDLSSAVAAVRKDIGRLRVQGLEESKARKHPATGFEIVTFDYKRTINTKAYTFRETVAYHGGKLYRMVLGAGDSTFQPATEVYDRMVGSLSFLR